MKTHHLISPAVILLFLLSQCGNADHKSESHQSYQEDNVAVDDYKYEEAEEAYAEMEGYENEDAGSPYAPGLAERSKLKRDQTSLFISSSAAQLNTDTSKKFIRTADIKFKAKNVRQTTFSVENIIRELEGFVTYTNLVSEIDYTQQNKVSKDSVLKSTYYTVQNNMVLRVPQRNLDTTLKRIAPLVDYLDYRLIRADEITFTLIANKLAKKRLANYNARLSKAIDKKEGDLQDVTASEQSLLNKQEQTDNVYIEDLKVMDRVAYSTINLNIYQDQAVFYEMIKAEKEAKRYEPSFGEEIRDSLSMGWKIIEYFIIFLAKIWVLLILAIIGLIVYKRVVKKKVKK